VSFSCGAECLNLALNVVCCETALRLKLRDKPTLRGHRKSVVPEPKATLQSEKLTLDAPPLYLWLNFNRGAFPWGSNGWTFHDNGRDSLRHDGAYVLWDRFCAG